MTPKEKAEELVDRYYWVFGDGYLGGMHIQCALIAQKMLLLKLKELNIEDYFEENVLFEINAL